MSNKITYCKYCGCEIDKNKKCTGCGKQYFKFPKLHTVITCLLVFALIIVCISWYGLEEMYYNVVAENTEIKSSYNELKTKYEEKQDELNEIESQRDKFKESNEHYQSLLSEYRETAQFWNKYGAIITETGTKYHTYNCQYISGISDKYVMTIWEAEDAGYTPCSKCH